MSNFMSVGNADYSLLGDQNTNNTNTEQFNNNLNEEFGFFNPYRRNRRFGNIRPGSNNSRNSRESRSSRGSRTSVNSPRLIQQANTFNNVYRPVGDSGKFTSRKGWTVGCGWDCHQNLCTKEGGQWVGNHNEYACQMKVNSPTNKRSGSWGRHGSWAKRFGSWNRNRSGSFDIHDPEFLRAFYARRPRNAKELVSLMASLGKRPRTASPADWARLFHRRPSQGSVSPRPVSRRPSQPTSSRTTSPQTRTTSPQTAKLLSAITAAAATAKLASASKPVSRAKPSRHSRPSTQTKSIIKSICSHIKTI